MGFKTVTAKLGNMRKEGRFVLYPQSANDLDRVIIQSDKRIAVVTLSTGEALLSDGKGGHQGFHKLSPAMGATRIVVPASTLEELRALCATNRPGEGIGSVTICG